jgi:hypothetical protein
MLAKNAVANLTGHVQSENHYARIRRRGKLIWKMVTAQILS